MTGGRSYRSPGAAPGPFGHAVTADRRAVVPCSSFAPMSARSAALDLPDLGAQQHVDGFETFGPLLLGQALSLQVRADADECRQALRVARRIAALDSWREIIREPDLLAGTSADLRGIRKPVTNQVTTAPGNTRRSATRPDTDICLACGNLT